MGAGKVRLCERCHKELKDWSVHNDYILVDCMGSMRVCRECSDEWDVVMKAYLKAGGIKQSIRDSRPGGGK